MRKDARLNPNKSSSILYCNGNGVFGFGQADLLFQNDFEKCSSELENSYTYNFQQKSEEAKTFLCGTMIFKPENVEFWALTQLRSSLDF